MRGTLIHFVVIVILMVSLAVVEAIVPLRSRPRGPRTRSNLALGALTIAQNVLLGLVLIGVAARLGPSAIVAALPPVVVAVAGILVLDGSTYLAHRLMHALP